jgi:CRP-like cAMP-binding protein
VSITLGQVLHESGIAMHHIYFPTTSIVSLLHIMEDGASAEIAVIGNEGVVGISQIMGGETMPNLAVVRGVGEAYRLKTRELEDVFDRAGGRRNDNFRHLLQRYSLALMTQMAQTAVCNRHHCLDQQLCRWLLLSLDRLPSNELVVTHELVANMLGVRRESVTEAVMKLQNSGLIEHCRGHITVLNRRGLEARACECYAAVKSETVRLFPEPVAA